MKNSETVPNLLVTNDNIVDDLSGTTKLVRKQKLITNFIFFASSQPFFLIMCFFLNIYIYIYAK